MLRGYRWKIYEKTTSPIFSLNHGNLNMDGFFFGMESNFSRNLIVRFHVKFQGCFQEGEVYMDIQFLYAHNVFFNHHGMESMQSSKIQSVQNSTNMNICCRVFPTTRARILGCYFVVFVCLGNLIATVVRSLVSEHPSRIGHALSTSHGNFGR